MKRDLDLIREILLSIESYEPERIGFIQIISPKGFSGTEPQNAYHIRMLIDAGIVDANGRPTMSLQYAINGLTMEGHDFLDAIRDASIWDATKSRVAAVGSWTLDIVLAVAKDEIKKRLGGVF